MPRKDSEKKRTSTRDLLVLNLPVINQLKRTGRWTSEVLADGDSEKIRLSFTPKSGMEYFTADEVRDAFLKLRSNLEAQEFFEQFGPYNNALSKSGFVEYRMALLSHQQAKIWNQRKMSHSRWFHGPHETVIDYLEKWSPAIQFIVGDRPALLIDSLNVSDAIRSSVYVDHLAGVEISSCLVCKQPFRVNTTGRRKIFCDDVCKNKSTKARYVAKHKLGDVKNAKA